MLVGILYISTYITYIGWPSSAPVTLPLWFTAQMAELHRRCRARLKRARGWPPMPERVYFGLGGSARRTQPRPLRGRKYLAQACVNIFASCIVRLIGSSVGVTGAHRRTLWNVEGSWEFAAVPIYFRKGSYTTVDIEARTLILDAVLCGLCDPGVVSSSARCFRALWCMNVWCARVVSTSAWHAFTA